MSQCNFEIDWMDFHCPRQAEHGEFCVFHVEKLTNLEKEEYNIFSDTSHHAVSVKEWAADYLSAMSLCASIVTFQKDRFYEPLPGISRLWLFLAVIAFAGQSAMTLLALRRRFRR